MFTTSGVTRRAASKVYLTIPEFAFLVGLTENWISHLIHKRKIKSLPGSSGVGRYSLIPATELEKYGLIYA